MNLKFFIFILLLQVISYADAMKHFILISFTLFVYSCGQSTAHSGSKAGEMIPSRDTCESPDMDLRCYFRDMPEKLNSQMVIANGGEPGERLTIRGRLVNTDGGPVASAIIYAYHTDRDGIYSKKGNEKARKNITVIFTAGVKQMHRATMKYILSAPLLIPAEVLLRIYMRQSWRLAKALITSTISFSKAIPC